MALKAIYVSDELQKRLIREANEQGLTIDEYLATGAGAKAAAPTNGNGVNHATASSSVGPIDWSQRIREMGDYQMLRAMGSGVMPQGAGPAASDQVLVQVVERLEAIEDRLKPAQSAAPADPLGMDNIIQQALRYRMMAPILRSIGGDDDGGSGSKAMREVEKELRDRVDKAQAQMLAELRAKDVQLADLKDKQSEQRIADMKNVVDGLSEDISALTDQLARGGPRTEQTGVAEQLMSALTQAQQVQNALTQIANVNRPAAPVPGQERDPVQTIAYLANELGGAVSKGLEAYARVNAANHGQNPDAIGRMPPPGSPVPVYRPQYTADRGQPAPPPRAAPPRPPRAPVMSGSGVGLVFEGAQPSRASASAARAPPRAPPEEPQAEAPEALPELPPLNPSVTSFRGPDGAPISRDDYEAIRRQVYEQTGRDPAQVIDMGPAPPESAEAEPAPQEEPHGESEPTAPEQPADEGPAQGE